MTLEKFRGIGNSASCHKVASTVRSQKTQKVGVFNLVHSILGMHGVISAESRFCRSGFISGTWCGTPKMQILKCLRIGPVVSARDRMWNRSRKRGQHSSLSQSFMLTDYQSQRLFRDFRHRNVEVKLEWKLLKGKVPPTPLDESSRLWPEVTCKSGAIEGSCAKRL